MKKKNCKEMSFKHLPLPREFAGVMRDFCLQKTEIEFYYYPLYIHIYV